MGVFEQYHAFEEAFDTTLPPPVPVLDQLVEDLLTEGRIEPARGALAWLVEGYGQTRNQAELESMIAASSTTAQQSSSPQLTSTIRIAPQHAPRITDLRTRW